MNIFSVDEDPILAAQMLPNKLLVKMPIESAQILSTALRWYLTEEEIGSAKQYIYNPTHVNHPATKWTRRSVANFAWLYEHGIALCKEYTRVYGREHACQSKIEWCWSLMLNRYIRVRPGFRVSRENITPFPQCMPEKYKISGDHVTAYRNYMVAEKSYYAKFSPPSQRPKWWRE